MATTPIHSKSSGAEARGAEDHLRAAMRRLLDSATIDPARDARLAVSCFEAGIVDIGVSFALRAASEFRVRGELESFEHSLAAAERHARNMRPDAVERLARERCTGGDAQGAAALLAAAAAQRLAWGSPEQALRLCFEAARCAGDARGLHRTWALALLGAGDPDGGIAHIDCWSRDEPDSLAAAAWAVEACQRGRRAGELAARFARLRELAGACPSPELHARIRDHLACTGETVAITPAPFWEREEWQGPPEISEIRRRIWLGADFLFAGRALAPLLEGAGFEVVGRTAPEPSRGPIDLAVVPLGPPFAVAGMLSDLRRTPGRDAVPALGVPSGPLSTLDFATLLRLGVIGLLHPSMAADQVVSRVRQCVERSWPERRLHARIGVDFPVTVDDRGRRSEQRADSLSCAGMRLQSTQAFELNRELGLRFRLHGEGDDWIETQGRVIYCRNGEDDRANHLVGIFFFDLDSRYSERIEAEVARALAEALSVSQGGPDVGPLRPR